MSHSRLSIVIDPSIHPGQGIHSQHRRRRQAEKQLPLLRHDLYEYEATNPMVVTRGARHIISIPMAHLKPWPPSINALTWIRALNRRRIGTLSSVGYSLSFPCLSNNLLNETAQVRTMYGRPRPSYSPPF